MPVIEIAPFSPPPFPLFLAGLGQPGDTSLARTGSSGTFAEREPSLAGFPSFPPFPVGFRLLNNTDVGMPILRSFSLPNENRLGSGHTTEVLDVVARDLQPEDS